MITKTDVANLFLQNAVVLPPYFLDSDASFWCVLQTPMHSPSRRQFSHILWEPTPTLKISGRDFGTHIFFLGLWGLAI